MNYKQTIELYKEYLTTDRKDWDGVIRKPLKSSVFKSMAATQQKIGLNPIEVYKNINFEELLFWSDMHFNHKNIIKYAKRPFESVGEMNNIMIDNYLKKVKNDDIVVFGGDIGFGEEKDIGDIIKNLPGVKILVLGNHDFNKNNQRFRNYNGFDLITMAFSFNLNNISYVVTHYPIDTKMLGEKINIHGHIHQHLIDEKHINMCVEHTNYTPKKIRELI